MWHDVALVVVVALTFGIGGAGVTQFLKAPFKRRRLLKRSERRRKDAEDLRKRVGPFGQAHTAEDVAAWTRVWRSAVDTEAQADTLEDEAYAAGVRALPSLFGTLAGIVGGLPLGPYAALWPELGVHPLVGVFVGAAGGYTGLAIWSAFKGTLFPGIMGTWRAVWTRISGKPAPAPDDGWTYPDARPTRIDTLEGDHDGDTLTTEDGIPPVRG